MSGSQSVPFCCFHKILLHTSTMLTAPTEIKLGFEMSLICCQRESFHSFSIIDVQSLSFDVIVPNQILSTSVSLLCSSSVPFDGFLHVFLPGYFSVFVHPGKAVLRFDMILFRSQRVIVKSF